MKLTNLTINTLHNLYYPKHYSLNSYVVHDREDFINNTINTSFIELDLSNPNEILMPNIIITNNLIKFIEDLFNNTENQNTNKTIVIPIKYNNKVNTVKTFSQIYNSNYTDFIYRFVTTSKGEKYYVGHNSILDSQQKILMMPVVKYAIFKIDNCAQMVAKEPLLYINPSVFTSKGTIEKGIINGIIPYVISRTFTNAIWDYNSSTWQSKTVNPSIVIKDISDTFIKKFNIIKKESNKNLNKLLLMNIDEVDNINISFNIHD